MNKIVISIGSNGRCRESDVVALHQQLRVRIKAIDTERRRIALTLKNVDQQ